jgi:hypothetical protein
MYEEMYKHKLDVRDDLLIHPFSFELVCTDNDIQDIKIKGFMGSEP